MLPVLSREQAQAFDAYTSEAWRVPSLLLMENAGRGAVEVIAHAIQRTGRIVIVTGAGNNAGDGFVVARRLTLLGYRVKVFALCAMDLLKGDARSNCQAFVAIGGAVHPCWDHDQLNDLDAALADCDGIVDAIFGTGLTREVTGQYRKAIEHINRARTLQPRPLVFSLDLPTGLDANRGQILGAAVHADVTVCFAHHKVGHLTANGADMCGDVRVVDIGVPSVVPPQIGQVASLLEPQDVLHLLQARPMSAHKGSVGRVMVFAGSPGKVGAALLVGRAALRAGAGVVTLAGFPEVTDLLDRRVQELMTARLQRDHVEQSVEQLCAEADAIVIGPGLGLDAEAMKVVRAVLASAKPIVMDADALTQFAGKAGELRRATGPLLLTPHPGELGRLLGTSSQQVEGDRLAAVTAMVDLCRATVLLKGPYTVIGSVGEKPIIHAARAPMLATAGSGDVLAGILGAFCTGLAVRDAAQLGTFVHARSAEAWQQHNALADRGLLAHEVTDWVPRIIAGLANPSAPLPV